MVLYNEVRPTSFDAVIGHNPIVEDLKRIIQKCKVNNERLPDMLFMGPPGCGKTTIAYCVAKEAGIPIQEINASDERGIDIVRGKIKDISRLAGRRILLLDEADEMTDDAQSALRRIMERSQGTTFILTANQPYKIIQPIHSRCVEFTFRQLQPSEIKQLIISTLKKKGITFQSLSLDEKKQVTDGLETLVRESNGDMRKALTILEKIISSNKVISTKEVIQNRKSELIPEVLRLSYNGDFEKAKELLEEAFILEQFNSSVIIKDFFEAIGKEINDREVKIFLYTKLAETEDRLTRGNNPVIQLVSFLSYVFVAPRLDGKVVMAARA